MNGTEHTTRPEPPASHRPRSYLSTAIALVAVVIALTTTAEALPGRNKVETNDIRRNAITSPKINKGAVTPAKIRDHPMWALVASDGSIIKSRGVASVTRDSTGVYYVRFSKSAAARPMSVTINYTGGGSGSAAYVYCDTTNPGGQSCLGGDSPKLVGVATINAAGAAADRSFMVIALPNTPGVTTSAARVSPRDRSTNVFR